MIMNPESKLVLFVKKHGGWIVAGLVVLFCFCNAPKAQAEYRDGIWSEASIGMKTIINPGFGYQPNLAFGLGMDRVLIDAQFGFNLTTAVDSTLLSTVGVGAKVFIWSGSVWKFEDFQVYAKGTARSAAGETKIDFKTGEIGFGLRPDITAGNKVMMEFEVVWLAAQDVSKHLGLNAALVFII